MVCNRCKTAVKDILVKFGIQPISVELGEIEISEDLDIEQKKHLNKILVSSGFELIADKKSRLIEKIKNTIVELVHYSRDTPRTNLSEHISKNLHHDYNYLSNLFSETEGITIEKYLISQKLEKVKELLKYDELSLTEIANQLGYSSVAYLCNQFKKQTGLTPGNFKRMIENKRKPLDTL